MRMEQAQSLSFLSALSFLYGKPSFIECLLFQVTPETHSFKLMFKRFLIIAIICWIHLLACILNRQAWMQHMQKTCITFLASLLLAWMDLGSFQFAYVSHALPSQNKTEEFIFILIIWRHDIKTEHYVLMFSISQS